MPITQSAKKAVRQSARRKAINDRRSRSMKEAVKAVKSAKTPDAGLVSAAYQAIDKAVKGGLLHKNAGARKKSLVARTASISKLEKKVVKATKTKKTASE